MSNNKKSSVVPESNTSDYLCTVYGYTKKIISDKSLVGDMLIREIQQRCHEQGFTLLEIKIKEIE
jgi:hypothetical protein